jgi:hypothetical protein
MVPSASRPDPRPPRVSPDTSNGDVMPDMEDGPARGPKSIDARVCYARCGFTRWTLATRGKGREFQPYHRPSIAIACQQPRPCGFVWSASSRHAGTDSEAE